VAGIPLLTDNHVREPILKALRARAWDIVRGVDTLGEGNDDEELLVWSSREGRALVTNDDGIHEIAHRWLREGRPFRMIYWKLEHCRKMSDGDFVEALEEIAAKPGAFAYPIEYIKPRW
jgi:hypothetical protein